MNSKSGTVKSKKGLTNFRRRGGVKVERFKSLEVEKLGG